MHTQCSRCLALGLPVVFLATAFLFSPVRASAQETPNYRAMDPVAAFAYAQTLIAEGSRDQAMKVLQFINEAFPQTNEGPRALYLLANLVTNNGRVDEGVALYDRLRKEHPGHWTVTSGGVAQYVAQIHAGTKNHQAVIDTIQDALERHDPATNTAAWALAIIRMAQAHVALGQLAEGRKLLDERIPKCPWLVTRPEFFDTLSGLQIKQKDYAGAQATARAAYAVCRFDEKRIKQAVELVRRVFMGVGNAQAGIAFIGAQERADAPNPLLDTPLPSLPPKVRTAFLAASANDPVLRLCSLLYVGDTETALDVAAERMYEASAEDAIAAIQDVARVLKAADLSLVRANQFIMFSKTGEGENPLVTGIAP